MSRKPDVDVVLLQLLNVMPTHSSDLYRAVCNLGFTYSDSAVVGTHLHALQRDGLLESHWEIYESGPPRKVYTITAEGIAYVRRKAGNFQ